jgi:membrane protein
MDTISAFFKRHPGLSTFIGKLRKDNVGFLASALAWSLLTSMVPVIVGLVGIIGLVLRDSSKQSVVVSHLSQALQGVLTPKEIGDLVTASTRHSALFAAIGILGIFWGGSNLGGTISTVFQPIFQVRGRDWYVEKLIDVLMFLVFIVLMIVVIAAASAEALLGRLFSNVALPGVMQLLVGTAVALLAAFLLFSVTYLVFPNTKPRFKFHNVWPGAGIAAVLFQVLSYMWPIYARFSHFSHYSAVIFSLLLFAAWLYFLATILIIGAEFVSIGALRGSRANKEPARPLPDGTVPQRLDDETDAGMTATA